MASYSLTKKNFGKVLHNVKKVSMVITFKLKTIPVINVIPTIRHFRVPLSLPFKASLSTKSLL